MGAAPLELPAVAAWVGVVALRVGAAVLGLLAVVVAVAVEDEGVDLRVAAVVLVLAVLTLLVLALLAALAVVAVFSSLLALAVRLAVRVFFWAVADLVSFPFCMAAETVFFAPDLALLPRVAATSAAWPAFLDDAALRDDSGLPGLARVGGCAIRCGDLGSSRRTLTCRLGSST